MLYNLIHLKNIPEVIFAHTFSCPDYQYAFKTMAPNIEIAYIETGALYVEIGNEKFVAEEKGFLITPHKYAYNLKAVENKSHIHFTVSALTDVDSKLIEGESDFESDILRVPVYLPQCSKTPELSGLLKRIINEYQSESSISKYKCGALFAELLCSIAQAEETERLTKNYTAADIIDSRIKKYIHNNLNQKILLSDIAESIGKNPNYINQVFRRKNDISIIQYINVMKMKKVAALIADNGMSIKEAAKEVGISDESYLSRLFKKTMGMTISEFKSNSADVTFLLIDHEKVF